MDTNPRANSPIDRQSGRTMSMRGQDKVISAVVNKLVPRANTNLHSGTTRMPNQHELSPIIRDTIQRSHDADNVMETLPDLEMVADISISGILSSNDLITTTLVYESAVDDLPMELRDEMIKTIKRYFDDDFELPSKLYDIFYDVMFKTGSYAVGIIPESSVDKLINGNAKDGKVSLENHKEEIANSLDPIGILGSTSEKPSTSKGIGLEALFATNNNVATKDELRIDFESQTFGPIQITDNANVCKLPQLKNQMAASKIQSAYNVAVEGVDLGNVRNIDRGYFKNPLYTAQAMQEVKTAEAVGRPSVGRPLVQHFPSESVIPIHTPGDMKIHVGYIIVLDNLGNPVSKTDLVNSSVAWNWINGDASSKLLQDTAEGMGLGKNGQEDWTCSQLTNKFADFVESKLINALKNGVYGESVTMARPQDVYRIMMARSLAKQSTQLLYIPSEQMAYFAFDYNDYGIGRSTIERTRILSTIRSALAFATMQASVLNATRNVEYNIVLDPNDREPQKTIDDVEYRIMQTFASNVPYTGTPDDVMAYITNAGISFNVEGNDYYPSTKVTTNDNTPYYKVPDREIDDGFAEKQYRGLGVDPDLVMNPENIEFAKQITSKSILTAKRICKIQEKAAPLLTHFCKTYILSDGILIKELADIIKEHLPEECEQAGVTGKYLRMFLSRFKVSLPPPDTSMLASQMEEFEDFSEAVDKMVEVWITEEGIGNTEIEIDVDRARYLAANYIKRQWLRRNNVCPELLEMFDDEDKREEIVKSIGEDNLRIGKLMGMSIKRVDKRMSTLANNLDLDEPTDGGFGSGDGMSDEMTDELGEDGSDGFGGDEFGSDTDTMGDDLDLGPDDNFEEGDELDNNNSTFEDIEEEEPQDPLEENEEDEKYNF